MSPLQEEADTGGRNKYVCRSTKKSGHSVKLTYINYVVFKAKPTAVEIMLAVVTVINFLNINTVDLFVV